MTCKYAHGNVCNTLMFKHVLIINVYNSEPLHAKTRFFLYENKDAVTAQLISALVYSTQIIQTADQRPYLLYTDNSNFLNSKFQASEFCDCVEGILSEEGFSRAAAHVKVVSHNYLQRFSHRTQ